MIFAWLEYQICIFVMVSRELVSALGRPADPCEPMTNPTSPSALGPSRRPSSPGWWWVIAISALGVAAASLRYLAGIDMVPTPLRLNFLDHPLMFWTHIVCGGVALAVGPWQFLRACGAAPAGFTRRSAVSMWRPA